MASQKLLLWLAAALLAACGNSPSSGDFKDVANALIKEQLSMQSSLIGALTGKKLDQGEMPQAVSVDNIRSADGGSTYTADVTVEDKGSRERRTISLSMRKIDGKWQRVR